MGKTKNFREHSEIVAVLFDANTGTLKGYDVSTRKWNQMQAYAADMKKWNFTAVVLNEDIYVLMANKAVYRSSYAIDDSCWTRMPDMTCDHGQYPPATVLNGRIYVHGTAGVGVESASGERFDPALNHWQTIPDMATARRGHAIASTVDFVYCFAGQNAEGELGSVEKYTENTGTWSNVAPIPIPRHSAAAVELNNKIYVTCGWSSGRRLCDVEMYDTTSNIWHVIKATTIPRSLPKACLVGGELMVIGGDESRNETMENYSTQKKIWEVCPLSDVRLDAAVSIP